MRKIVRTQNWFDSSYTYRKMLFEEVYRCQGGVVYKQVGKNQNFEVYFDMRELYRPSKSQWGRRAWTVNTLERAIKILQVQAREYEFKIKANGKKEC